MSGTFGNGGPNGARVYWPAGLQELSPVDRAAALKRGWWRDGTGHIITKDGRRLRETGVFARESDGIGRGTGTDAA